MKQYTVQYGQSIYDVAAQLYGHVDGVFLLVTDNPQYAITDVPVPGSVLLYREVVPKLSDSNEAIAREYAAGEITVACGMATNLTVPGAYVEDGYWLTGYVRNNG